MCVAKGKNIFFSCTAVTSRCEYTLFYIYSYCFSKIDLSQDLDMLNSMILDGQIFRFRFTFTTDDVYIEKQVSNLYFKYAIYTIQSYFYSVRLNNW